MMLDAQGTRKERCDVVKLTEQQENLLRAAQVQTDNYTELWPLDKHVADCEKLASDGLLLEMFPSVFIITKTGRAWLAEKENEA